MWNSYNLCITLDITTYCNAKCPQCHRTDALGGGLKKVDWLPLKHVNLKTIKKWFPPEALKYIYRINHCPTWGDSMMNPEIYEITEYMLKNSNVLININTNGSMRNEDFWYSFANLAVKYPKRIVVAFDVDGIDQKMHSKYRIGTDLNKIFKNMNILSEAKKWIKVTTQTIVFKHNQDYMKDIKELCEKHGSTHHLFVKSDRFAPSNDKFYFKDENGKEQFLEFADKAFKDSYVAGLKSENLKEDIICRWGINDSLQINYDGQIHPCCFFGNTHARGNSSQYNNSELTKRYIEKQNEYNLNFTPFREIINSDWFQNQILADHKSDNPHIKCLQNCSSKTTKPQRKQSRTYVAN